MAIDLTYVINRVLRHDVGPIPGVRQRPWPLPTVEARSEIESAFSILVTNFGAGWPGVRDSVVLLDDFRQMAALLTRMRDLVQAEVRLGNATF